MKSLVFTLFLSIVFLNVFAQRSTGIVISQGFIQNIQPVNLMTVDTTTAGNFNFKLARTENIKFYVMQIQGMQDSVLNWGNLNYARLAGSYPDASFIPSLSASKVFGLSSVALTGNYSDLNGLPNLSNYYLASNPSGYINAAAITVPFLNGIYGYTPQPQINGIGFVKASGTTISYDNSTYLTSEVDGNPSNELQTVSKTGNIVTLDQGGGSFSVADNDSSTTNEVQTLSGSNRTITLSLSGGSYTLPQANWDSLQNRPTIPAQANITGAQNTKITGSYPNLILSDSFTTRYYNASGLISQNIKVWTSTVTPSTSNGYSIDISSAGFSTILSAQVIAERNTASASTSPNVSIKTKSTSAIVVNVVEDNPATVAILGISVLSGLPSIFANVTGLTLSVTVIGY